MLLKLLFIFINKGPFPKAKKYSVSMNRTYFLDLAIECPGRFALKNELKFQASILTLHLISYSGKNARFAGKTLTFPVGYFFRRDLLIGSAVTKEYGDRYCK